MFTNISWANYLMVVALLLAAYYLVIGIRFYSHELHHLLSGSRKPALTPVPDSIIGTPDENLSTAAFTDKEAEQFLAENSSMQTGDNSYQEVEQMTHRLKEVIAEAASEQHGKQELIQSLQQVLKAYSSFNDPTFQSTIQDLITLECEKYESIMLSEEELVQLFDELA